MSSSSSKPSSSGRMRATDAYWDQLMRTPAQVAEDHAQHERELIAARPPLAPIDQHAVMIRLLAEDNRANLDVFCERVDGLTKGLEDVRRETAGARTLFETEQEKVVGEIVELTDRSQTIIVRAVKEQTAVLPEVKRQVDSNTSKLDSVDRKLDTLQLQCQTQTSALQHLQDQLATLLATLTPVLPLLQNLTTHIDNVHLKLKDSIREGLMETQTATHTSIKDLLDASQEGTKGSISTLRAEIADLRHSVLVQPTSSRRHGRGHVQPILSGLPPSSAEPGELPTATSPPPQPLSPTGTSHKRRRLDPAFDNSPSDSQPSSSSTGSSNSAGSSQRSVPSQQAILPIGSSYPLGPGPEAGAGTSAGTEAGSIIPPSTDREIEMTPPYKKVKATHVSQRTFSAARTPLATVQPQPQPQPQNQNQNQNTPRQVQQSTPRSTSDRARVPFGGRPGVPSYPLQSIPPLARSPSVWSTIPETSSDRREPVSSPLAPVHGSVQIFGPAHTATLAVALKFVSASGATRASTSASDVASTSTSVPATATLRHPATASTPAPISNDGRLQTRQHDLNHLSHLSHHKQSNIHNPQNLPPPPQVLPSTPSGSYPPIAAHKRERTSSLTTMSPLSSPSPSPSKSAAKRQVPQFGSGFGFGSGTGLGGEAGSGSGLGSGSRGPLMSLRERRALAPVQMNRGPRTWTMESIESDSTSLDEGWDQMDESR